MCDAGCVSVMLQVFGVPPAAVVERCKRSDKFFQGQTPRYLNNPSKRVRRGPPNSVSLSSLLKDTDVSTTVKDRMLYRGSKRFSLVSCSPQTQSDKKKFADV